MKQVSFYLFYFILFYFILFYFILFYFILFYFILFYLFIYLFSFIITVFVLFSFFFFFVFFFLFPFLFYFSLSSLLLNSQGEEKCMYCYNSSNCVVFPEGDQTNCEETPICLLNDGTLLWNVTEVRFFFFFFLSFPLFFSFLFFSFSLLFFLFLQIKQKKNRKNVQRLDPAVSVMKTKLPPPTKRNVKHQDFARILI